MGVVGCLEAGPSLGVIFCGIWGLSNVLCHGLVLPGGGGVSGWGDSIVKEGEFFWCGRLVFGILFGGRVVYVSFLRFSPFGSWGGIR